VAVVPKKANHQGANHPENQPEGRRRGRVQRSEKPFGQKERRHRAVV